ncbi:MAG: carboxypeptidase-like regulatory domain-containing protein, partial [Acidobacteriota bacterium]|nr:carboxypeptidase-like regulatory domain-containing protein [Acidobacteriota bacterium]
MNESFIKRISNSLLSIFAVFCLIASASSVFAQVTAGNLQGVVADPNGAIVAGASVKITNPETGQVKETTTNSDGIYTFTSLQPSERYVLEVSGTGFAPTRVENVVIRIGSQNSQNVSLG